MGFNAWLAQRRATWRPVQGSRAGMVFLFICLATFIGGGISTVQIDMSGLLQHPTPVSEDVLLTTALCLLCLGQMAMRTRFQLTARVLTGAVFPVLALFCYHRWAR